MSALLLEALIKANLAAAIGVVVVLAARPHVLKFLGARAAYLSWTVIPVLVLAILIPSRAIEVAAPAVRLPTGMEDLSAVSAHHAAPIDWLSAIAAPVMLVWLAGALGMGVILALRQQRFLLDMSLGLAGPAVVGFRRQRIVTPDDFTRRYSFAEQKLILAHELVHLERHDARINALAALARCVCWFNPLVHLGAHTMRIDQELSCDAAVVERRPRARRAYAETLLKTQLASRPLPVGCYWPAPTHENASIHPLTERIDMLTRKPISQRRRMTATAAVLSLALTAGAAAWAAQPERKIQSTIETPPILAGEAPEILLPLQPIAPRGHAPARSAIRLTPGTPAPQDETQPRLRTEGVTYPDYPADAADARIEGMVTLELCVSKTGAVASAKVQKSSGFPTLDEAAMRWATTNSFDPATRHGKPVDVCNYPLSYDRRLKEPLSYDRRLKEPPGKSPPG